ncbi:siderophore-iron reductase FhuF [Azospirillum sp. SYSU D00513]|uniref:siderophore-iron reductase FhuF n=1 Tax=Azospirillum sp. SYSU D00513 TaxID=2812561 RepID=UPI001A96E6B6|nr:siderophore-iron reductase FhuF [Azospirillum sp. SYSU D00513]
MKGWQAVAACLEVVTMRADPGVETVPLRRLAEPETVVPLVQRFGRAYPEGDRRAVASMWVKYYCRMVLSPLIAFSLRDRSALLEEENEPALILAGRLPYGLLLPRLPSPGRTLDDIYGTGLRDHMAPVFAALADGFGLSPRVSWANAGVIADHVLTTLAEDPEPDDPGLAARAREDRAAVIAARTTSWFPDGNPLYEPVRTVEVALDGRLVRHRQQRVCCIRDLVPGMPLCGNCPKLKGDALEAVLRG